MVPTTRCPMSGVDGTWVASVRACLWATPWWAASSGSNSIRLRLHVDPVGVPDAEWIALRERRLDAVIASGRGRLQAGQHRLIPATDRVGRLRWVPAVVVVPLLALACGDSWTDQPIATVEVRDDDRTLVVGYHCDYNASIEAEETDEEVRLTFRVNGGNRGDCADVEELELDAPLEERDLIDTSNGEEITPCRAMSPAGGPCN